MEGLDKIVAIEVGRRRQELGMTQSELADRLTITRGSISNIEGGRQALSLELFCKVADALNTTPPEFLYKCLHDNRIYIDKSEIDNDKLRDTLNDIIAS